MITLTKAISQTKILLKWLGILLSILIFVIIIKNFILDLKERLSPTRPPPPTVAFGKLPPISFPKNVTDKSFTYSLDTITGLFPTLPLQVKVHRMVEIKPEFLALDKARQKVALLGFKSKEAYISENLYRWVDETPPSREITYNLFSHDFNLSSSFLSDPISTQSQGKFLDQNSAVNSSQRFLSIISSFPDDIDLAKTKTLLYSIKDNTLNPATSVSNAAVIRVDFFQKNINDLPIYYPNYSTSTINLLVIALRNNNLVVGSNFHYQPISNESYTYPIKTASEAFNELKNQKSYIVSYFSNDTNIPIKNISLGYYIGTEKQNYLMPIVVFEGVNGFVAFVSAVRDEWINN